MPFLVVLNSARYDAGGGDAGGGGCGGDFVNVPANSSPAAASSFRQTTGCVSGFRESEGFGREPRLLVFGLWKVAAAATTSVVAAACSHSARETFVREKSRWRKLLQWREMVFLRRLKREASA